MRFISSSPLPKNCSSYAKEREGGSGEWIEEKLFGRHIQNLSVKESLFIFSMKDYKGGFESFRKEFEKCNKLNKGEFKYENFQKYIQKFNDIFVAFETEESNIDVDKSYILSNKKTENLGMGEDVFFYKLSHYFQKEFQDMENILLNECMQKIKKKNTAF